MKQITPVSAHLKVILKYEYEKHRILDTSHQNKCHFFS